MAQSGRLTTSDFMKMDKNDPRRQRWEETANKAHAQGMKELDKARYGSGSRQKAVQDPDSLEARVRDNSSTYGKTAEGKSYLHNKDQQAKSQAGADARTAARDYASQRREDTKSAYLEGQAAGRVQGRTAQAAVGRQREQGRGRGGYGGPPRGYGGRGGDPRQMRGGRGGVSSNPFRSGGRGRGQGERIGDPRQMRGGGSRGGSMPEAVFPGGSDPKKPYMDRKDQLSQKYDSEVFNKEKGVVGQYFHDYAGTNPMKKGGDEAAYMKGMKDNWVDRQMLGEKYDKEIFHKDPSGDTNKNVAGDMSHAFAYIDKSPMKKGGDEVAYLKGMRDDWIDKQQLGQKFDREVGTWQGDSDATWNQATKFRNDTEAGGYGNYVGDYAKANTDKKWDKAFFDSMKDDWVSKQTGYAAGVKNKIAEVQGKGKGKDFLDSKIGKTPEAAPPSADDLIKDNRIVNGTALWNRGKQKVRDKDEAPPQAAPPKGGMNTGATTDLNGVAAPPKATKPPITPPSDPYIPPSPTPPSYQEPARDYIKYKNKKPGGVSSDADRYALLTGKPSMGGGTTTPKGGSSTPDYSYDYGLGKGTSADADRYALLTGDYSGKSYLDKYLKR